MTTIIPADMPVIEAARLAAEKGLDLITDGRRTMLASVTPAGWVRLSVHQRSSNGRTAP